MLGVGGGMEGWLPRWGGVGRSRARDRARKAGESWRNEKTRRVRLVVGQVELWGGVFAEGASGSVGAAWGLPGSAAVEPKSGPQHIIKSFPYLDQAHSLSFLIRFISGYNRSCKL